MLRGIFLGIQSELDWLYKEGGAQHFYPEYYQDFIQPLAENLKHDPILGYKEIFTSGNEVAVVAASKAWFLWELRLSTIEHHHIGMAQIVDSHQALCMSKLSHHFFEHNCLY